MSGRDPRGGKASRPGSRVGPIAPRDRAPLRGGPRGDELGDALRGPRVRRECVFRMRPPAPPSRRRRRSQMGRPAKDTELRRDAERIGQAGPMQHRSQHRVVAKLRVAKHRRNLKARGPHLPHERQREPPLLLELGAGRDARPSTRRGGQPLLGEIELRRPASTPAPHSTARRSRPLGNWRSCPRRRSTAVPHQPNAGLASESSSRRGSARRCARGPRHAAGATSGRRPMAHR
jgi:hypothetical protein